MSIIFSLTGALLSGICCFAATRKWPQKGTIRNLPMLCLIAVSVLGACCGWMIFEKINGWTNYLRLFPIIAVLGISTYTDLDDHRIPNLCSLILLGCFAIVSALDFWVTPEQASVVLLGGVIGGVGVLLTLLLLRFLSRGGIGYGDIKLLASMGTLLGISGTISVLFVAQLSALAVAGLLLLMKKVTMKDSLPFAPFFYLGFLGSLCLGSF